MRKFMEEIITLVDNLLMDSSNLDSLSVSIFGAFFLSGESLLLVLKFLKRTMKVFWRSNLMTIAINSEIEQSHVNTYLLF